MKQKRRERTEQRDSRDESDKDIQSEVVKWRGRKAQKGVRNVRWRENFTVSE